MDELSQKWDDLTDIKQARITELIAGLRQGNVVSSLMENFDIAREALKTSQDSAGSATTEHERWLESLEAKLKQLASAWQGLSEAFLQDEALGELIDVGTTFLTIVTDIVELTGSLPATIGLIAGALSGIKNKGELIKQFQFLIILRIEYALEANANGNMNETMCKLVA